MKPRFEADLRSHIGGPVRSSVKVPERSYPGMRIGPMSAQKQVRRQEASVDGEEIRAVAPGHGCEFAGGNVEG